MFSYPRQTRLKVSEIFQLITTTHVGSTLRKEPHSRKVDKYGAVFVRRGSYGRLHAATCFAMCEAITSSLMLSYQFVLAHPQTLVPLVVNGANVGSYTLSVKDEFT